MRKIITAAMGAVLAGAILAASPAGASSTVSRPADVVLKVYGLTADQRIICFASNRPRYAEDHGPVTGLTMDTSLVGIDFRPATGELIGLGNQGGVYAIDQDTSAAVLKSRATVALNGASFGVDFNPTVDRLRIVSDTGQNLRVNVDLGDTTEDGLLDYAGVTALGIAGVAYTNNDADANTGTTLFDIDTVLDQVSIQAPPNDGILTMTGKVGADVPSVVGFDIFSVLKDGSAVDNLAFASYSTGPRTGFFSVEPLTGKATKLGEFRATNQVTDIAVYPGQGGW